MADKRIADFATLEEAQDDDLLLVSSEDETYNMKFRAIREYLQTLTGLVKDTRTINGKALNKDIELQAPDITYQGAVGGSELHTVGAALDAVIAAISAGLKTTAPNVQYQGMVGGVQVTDVSDALDELTLLAEDAVPKTRKVNGKPLTADVALTAVDVQYQGMVGGVQAGDVGEAIGILAAGVPLDMADDFAASGAASVQAWATMAKAGDPALYRVPAGRYAVPDATDEYSRIVTVTDIPGTSARSVWVQECDPLFCYITRYTSAGPGDSPTEAFYLSNEERRLSLGGSNCLLPDYGSADNGKFLRIANGLPQWQTLTNVAEVGA